MKAICIYGSKFQCNVGTIMRSAYLYDYDVIYTIGERYKRMATDTVNAGKHIPITRLQDFDQLYAVAKYTEASVVMVELSKRSKRLHNYTHPNNVIYVLGAEDTGIPESIIDKHVEHGFDVLEIPTPQKYSMNVAVAGSIVMYDRYCKEILATTGGDE